MRRVAILESSTGIGGAEINMLRLVQPLRARGWDLVFLVPGRGGLSRELDRRGVEWHQTPSCPFKSTSRYWERTKIADPLAVLYDSILVLQQARALPRIFRERRIDLVHTNSMLSHFTGGLGARWAGLPCVWHIQDIVDSGSFWGLFGQALKWGAETLPQSIVCISKTVAEQFKARKAEPKVRVVYNGIDTELFAPQGPQPFRAKWQEGGSQFVVGQVGRLTPWKGYDNLLLLAKYAKDARLPIRFVIVGDDSFGEPGYRAFLGAEARRLGLGDAIDFTGWVEDIPGALRSMDILVHLTKKPEPFGLAVAEAMACSRAVVVSDFGGTREVVGSRQCGAIIPPGDMRSAFAAMELFVNNSDWTREIGRQARQRIERTFSLSDFADGITRVYDEARKAKESDGATLRADSMRK